MSVNTVRSTNDPTFWFFSQKWVNALGDHIVYSTQMSGSINISDDEAEELPPLGSMQECLQNSQAHQQILERHVAMATKSIQEVTTVKENLGSHGERNMTVYQCEQRWKYIL